MTVIKGKFSSLKIDTKGIMSIIEREELERRKGAAKYATKIMKKNANNKGFSQPGGFPSRMIGTLYRSIGYKLIKGDRSAMVGSKDSKVHLLEFGHGDGKTRNKRPLINPSLREAEQGIIDIMSERYF